MSRKERVDKLVAGLMLSAVLLGLVGCDGAQPATGPRAWIDSPRDGASVPAGTPITIISHAYAEAGVADVLLLVDGVAYRRDPLMEAGGDFGEVRQEWVPETAGLHTLQVQAYDAAGAAGAGDEITVRVIGEVAAVPTEVPPTEVLPTDVPPTEVPPTDVPPTVPPPTDVPPTAPPPTDVPPTAPPPTDVPPTDVPPTDVPPTPTIDMPPTTPPDDTPPPVPTPYVPADGLVIDDCVDEQVLAWLPVQDDSGGPVTYRVVLEISIKVGQWDQVAEWNWVSGKQVTAEELSCGGIYRWRVRARDQAGNASAWSAWSGFSINFE